MSDTKKAVMFAMVAFLPGLTACSQSSSRQQPSSTTIVTPTLKVSEQPPVAAKPQQPSFIGPGDVLAAQKALAALGYNVGKADGVMGPTTRAALIAFQKDHGLATDGRMTVALLRLLDEQVAELPKPIVLTVRAGDGIIYADGSVDSSNYERTVRWDDDIGRPVVAVRPSTRGWPSAARAGFDWAISHALDSHDAGSMEWSSTGVEEKFEIKVFSTLSPGELKLANSGACRHFELKASFAPLRYPGIACKDSRGGWYFPHSRIRIARPAAALNASE